MAKGKATPPGEAEKPDTPSAAKDGDVHDLESRRRSRNGTSLAERVQNGSEDGDGDEPELFPAGTLEGDPKVTHKTYIPAASKTSTEVSMSRAAVPNPGGGLFRAGEEVQVLARVLPQSVKETPINVKQPDGSYKVKEWKITQELAVIFVQHADQMFTREQVVELLDKAGAAPAVISRLLGEDAAAAQG
jgi:hypothetical protein